MKRWLIGAALLFAAVGTPRAQSPQPSPLESRATELRDGLTTLIAMAKQSDQTATEATRRLEAVRAAVGGEAPPAPTATPEVQPSRPAPLVAGRVEIAEPRASAPVKSVWDFSPVAAALIQSLLLAIATLTPAVIGWVAWELRKRTGIAERQADTAVLSCAIRP